MHRAGLALSIVIVIAMSAAVYATSAAALRGPGTPTTYGVTSDAWPGMQEELARLNKQADFAISFPRLLPEGWRFLESRVLMSDTASISASAAGNARAPLPISELIYANETGDRLTIRQSSLPWRGALEPTGTLIALRSRTPAMLHELADDGVQVEWGSPTVTYTATTRVTASWDLLSFLQVCISIR